MSWFRFYNTVYHLENAGMTHELRDDLFNFSFTKLQDIFQNSRVQNSRGGYSILHFSPTFLKCLQKLVCHHLHSRIFRSFKHFSPI